MLPLLYTSNVFPTPSIEALCELRLGDLSYWTQKPVPEELRDVGFRTIEAFGTKTTFHCEFYPPERGQRGPWHKEGEYVALEVDVRPAGGYTPDLVNYANSVRTATRSGPTWYAMSELRHEKLDLPHHCCVYAGRRDCHTSKHSHEEILARFWPPDERCATAYPGTVLPLDMGNQMYVATLDTATERDAFVRCVQEQATCTGGKGLISAAFYFLIILF